MKHLLYLFVVLCFPIQSIAQQVQTLLVGKGTLNFVENNGEMIASLNFSKKTLENKANKNFSNIDTCFLQMTLIEQPREKGNIYITKSGNETMVISSLQIYRATKKDSVLTFALRKSVFDGPDSIKLLIHSKISSFSTLTPLAGNNHNIKMFRPRLLVKYTPFKTSSADWSGSRADYKNSNRSVANIKGAKVLTLETIDVLPPNAKALTNPVSFGGAIFVLANTGVENKTNLYKIIGKQCSLISEGLLNPRVDKTFTPVIDEDGRFYYLDGNNISVIDLTTGAKLNPVLLNDKAEKPSADLILGPDGSLYIVSGGVIMARSPYPDCSPLWEFSESVDFGKPAIDISNKSLYVIGSSNIKSTLYEINTISGKINHQTRVYIPQLERDKLPVTPILDDSNNVIITDRTTSSDTIRIYTYDLKILNKKIIKNINSPIALGSVNKNGLYFSTGANFCQAIDTIKTIDNIGGPIRSLASDINGNVYILQDKQLVLFNDNLISKTIFINLNISSDSQLMGSIDGNVYFKVGDLMKLGRPLAFQNEVNVSNVILDKLCTLRGQRLIVPTGFRLTNDMILWGRKGVSFEENATLSSTARIIIRSSDEGTIKFNNGFKVELGAELKCITNY